LSQQSKKCPTCGHIINNRKPNKLTLIAVSIYIASLLCGERRTQYEIKEITGVNPVSIRKHFRRIVDEQDINIKWLTINRRR